MSTTRGSMKFLLRSLVVILCLLSVTTLAAEEEEACQNYEQPEPPYVTASPTMYLPDEDAFGLMDIKTYWYSSTADDSSEQSCLDPKSVPPKLEARDIGQVPQFETYQAKAVLDEAVRAWDGGMGVWPQMSLGERIAAVERFLDELVHEREAIVNVLMWEIGKNRKDAESEFDRTLQFAREVIETIRTDPEFVGQWQTVGSSTTALVRRAAIGVIMCLGPYNYPLNETYATLIPALLLGNVILLKIPTVGGLVHLLTMEAFSKTLPKGTINFIAGSGRKTMPPLMETGLIDGLAFIGGSKAADDLILRHPHPHRLKVFLQLEAKNMGIYLPALFESANKELLDNAVNETLLGTLSFNGQRCTALKLLFCPTASADTFVERIVQRVQDLRVGLPWQASDGQYSQITPLPTRKRVQYMQSLIKDAQEKGAKIMNEGGGTLLGGSQSTLMVPAVLYPTTPDMKIYTEEQFGPIIPIAVYDDLETVLKFAQEGEFGQQVSIFGGSIIDTSHLVDRFSSIFGKINLNAQCGRSPDTLPFSGRRSSAMGVMSVKDASREFSVPTVVAYKHKNGLSEELVEGISAKAKFLEVYA